MSRYKVQMNPLIMTLPLNEDDLVARTIYEALYRDNPAMPRWEDIPYHAPETAPGYAARLIQQAANNLRSKGLINA